MFAYQEYEKKARPVLTAHIDHTATVNGWERVITPRSIEPETLTWCYGGFAVDCVTCEANLSQQWN